MNFDSKFYGSEELTDEDERYAGSLYSEVRKTLFETAYYDVWGRDDNPPLPNYGVTLCRVLKGALSRGRWKFLQAAKRALDSRADLRWGPDGRGFRRLLHPNGVCLFGRWIIDQAASNLGYTGYFAGGREGLIIGRYSTCCSETRRGRYRSLSLVGKIYPTTDPAHRDPLRTANFICQEDLGGSKTMYLGETTFSNAPNTTPWRRGWGLPIFLLTGAVFRTVDLQPTFRQLYPIAELDKLPSQPTSAPEFMRLVVDENQKPVYGDDLDLRDEILGCFYDRGIKERRTNAALIFHIEVSDEGVTKGKLVQRRDIKKWRRIGRIIFDDAVASYNGDFVLHFAHPPWRRDRNDPSTQVRM